MLEIQDRQDRDELYVREEVDQLKDEVRNFYHEHSIYDAAVQVVNKLSAHYLTHVPQHIHEKDFESNLADSSLN